MDQHRNTGFCDPETALRVDKDFCRMFFVCVRQFQRRKLNLCGKFRVLVGDAKRTFAGDVAVLYGSRGREGRIRKCREFPDHCR